MVLVVLAVGTVMAPLDASIVQIALPAIAGEFGARLASAGWVTTAYLLTAAALLLPMGRVGDIWGLKRLYITGLVVFALASIGCAAAGSLASLVLSRTVQATGAAMLFAAGPALVTRTFPPDRRGWALGYVSLAVAAGLSAGPALGGVLVGSFGWPSIFLVNVPLSIGAAAAAVRLLPRECPDRRGFDLLGAVLAAATLLLVLVGLSRADESGVTSSPVLGPLAMAAATGAGFVLWERRARDPLVELSIFSDREFSTGVFAATLSYLALFSVTFTMPFYLLRIHGFDPRFAGSLLTVTPLAMAALAPLAGRLSDRHGSRTLATLGVGVLALGLAAASLLTPSTPPGLVACALAVVGSGMAVFQTPNTAAILRAAPQDRVGVGSAFVAVARNVGMSLGAAIAATIVSAALGGRPLPAERAPLPPEVSQAFMHGMASALRVGATAALLAAVLSWFGRAPGEVVGRERSP